ncbi:MAG: hypothetical protein H6647_06815 [Anaerolineales bacterium]|nr:hypothetical protein [Anaerolineales bacterium]
MGDTGTIYEWCLIPGDSSGGEDPTSTSTR